MKAEDLRLGLFVKDLMNERQKQIDVNDIAIADKYQNKKLLSIPYEPIKLSAEWLIKFGFSDKEYKKGYIGIDLNDHSIVLQKPKFMGDWQTFYVFASPQICFVKLEFVHQLQNLFRDIENEDLVLN